MEKKIEKVFLVCAKSSVETYDYSVWSICTTKKHAVILMNYYTKKYDDLFIYISTRTIDDWFAEKIIEKAGD